jgi:hypothetical protein
VAREAHRVDEAALSLLSHFRRHQAADAIAKKSSCTNCLRRHPANRGERDSVARSGQALASARTSRLATILPVA